MPVKAIPPLAVKSLSKDIVSRVIGLNWGTNMLLRSSSAPILDSWFPQYSDEFHLSRNTRSISLPSSNNDQTRKLTNPALSEQNTQKDTSNHRKATQSIIPPRPLLTKQHTKQDGQGKPESKPSLPSVSTVGILFSSSGLGEKVLKGVEDCDLETVMGSGGTGDDGGKICNGGGGGESGFFGNNSHGSDGTDAYYQNMIQANPEDPLLLGNYAMFLKEVRGNLMKAEEYCERAILINPMDGIMLSLYADLIWKNRKDAHRAENYFDQAVRSAPDDCYVLASYARFLWDVEEDDEEADEEGLEKVEVKEKLGHEFEHGHGPLPPNIFHGASSLLSPLPAPS